MQLIDARLCLDCDEVHDSGICPVCGSESFAFLSRWVPAPASGRHPKPAPEQQQQAAVYRELLNAAPEQSPGRQRRMWKGGLLGLTALGLAGWAWRSSSRTESDKSNNGDA